YPLFPRRGGRLDHGQEVDVPALARTGPVRELERIAEALEAAAEGDFGIRLRVVGEGPFARIAEAASRLIARNAQLARELVRVSRRVAVDGRLSERAQPALLPGAYGDSLAALNDL